jgi:hypothetical protein
MVMARKKKYERKRKDSRMTNRIPDGSEFQKAREIPCRLLPRYSFFPSSKNRRVDDRLTSLYFLTIFSKEIYTNMYIIE